MGYIVEISDHKAHEMAEHAEKVLKHGGKLMQCIEELCEGARYGERGGYGRYGNRDGYMGERGDYMGRGGYGHIGMREPEMPHDGYDRMGERWEEDPYFMGERRGRSMSTGRYIRR